MAQIIIGSLQVLSQTAAAWSSENRTLLLGQWGHESDTGKVKIGDNSTAWNSLDYVTMTVAQLTALLAAKENIPAQAEIADSDISWNIQYHYKTLAANTTFTFSNLADAKTIQVAITNTASNYTVSWPSVQWSGGSAPTQTTGAKTDVYTFTRINGVVYGSVVQNFS